MPDSGVWSKVVVAAGLVMALGFGLTTYTSPFLGTVEGGELARLIHGSLGDPSAGLPGPPAAIGVIPVTPATIPLEDQRPGPARRVEPAPQPAAWVAAAAEADSAALRGWLGRFVVVTSRPRGDTVFATYRRLALGGGCPVVSHLRTVTVFSTRQLVRVTSDCPTVR